LQVNPAGDGEEFLGGVVCPWAWLLPGDVETFVIRWERFHCGFFWNEVVQAWQARNVRNLSSRVMRPARPHQTESSLIHEAHRPCIKSHDEPIGARATSPRDVLAHVDERRRELAQTPTAICGGFPPKAAMAREPKRIAVEEQELQRLYLRSCLRPRATLHKQRGTPTFPRSAALIRDR